MESMYGVSLKRILLAGWWIFGSASKLFPLEDYKTDRLYQNINNDKDLHSNIERLWILLAQELVLCIKLLTCFIDDLDVPDCSDAQTTIFMHKLLREAITLSCKLPGKCMYYTI